MDEQRQAMRLSGFDDEDRSNWIAADGEAVSENSPMDYMCAKYLIGSVRNRFPEEVIVLALELKKISSDRTEKMTK